MALLRAVNVGGTGRLPMADLLSVADELGWREAKTILQSGSLVFTATGKGPALESQLEAMLEKRHHLTTTVITRGAAQWAQLVAHNPFPEMADSDPSHLVLMVTKGGKAPTRFDPWSGEERIAVVDGDAYVAYPNGIGRSKLTTNVLEKRLGAPVTGRNWTTVQRIAAALGV